MGFDERDYARRRAEARQQSSWFKLNVGDNCFRIVPTPPTDTVKTNFYEYSIHREVGPRKQTVRCGIDIDPETGEQVGECWLCDTKIPQLKAKKQDSRATALASKAQVIMQVAKVEELGEGKTKFSGPFLFTPAPTIANQLLASIFGNRKRSYVDPKKGYNLNISRTGTGRNDTRYGVIEPDQDPSAVPQSLIDKVKPFEDLKEIPVYSQAKQQAAYLGQDVVEEDEDQEQPQTRRSAAPASRKAAVVQEPEDDEPVDDDVDDDAVDDVDDAGEDVNLDDDDVDLDPEPELELEPPSRKRAAAPAPAKAAARPASRKVVEPDPDEDTEEAIDPDTEDLPNDAEDDLEIDDADDAGDDLDPDDADVIDDEPDTPPSRTARPAARQAAKPAPAPARRAVAPPARPAARAVAPAKPTPGLRPKARR